MVFSPKYVASLVAAALVILIVGALIRPTDSPATTPSAAELARLTEASQRRAVDTFSAFFTRLADQVAGSIATVPALGRSAVVWSPDSVVTVPTATRPPDQMAVALAGVAGATTIQGWSPAVPVVRLMLASGGAPLTVPAAPATPTPAGTWVVAVWRPTPQRVFATGSFVSSTPVTCGEIQGEAVQSTVPLDERMAGGGLFDADGQLLAIVVPCGDRMAALTTSTVAKMLSAAQAVPGRMLARYGLRAAPLTPEEAAHVRTDRGLIVHEVWTGSAADESGFMPGDVIQMVNGNAVGAAEDLLAPAADTPVEISVWRWRSTVRLTLGPAAGAPGPPVGPDAGLRLDPPAGHRIAAVTPGSAAAAAGLQPGDRLLRVDGTAPRDAGEVARLLAGGRLPAFLEVRRDRRRLGMLVR